VRDHFDNWLAADTNPPVRSIDFLVLRPKNALSAVRRKRLRAKVRQPRKAAPARQAEPIARPGPRRHRDCSIVEGDSAGALAKARATGVNKPLLPLKGKILNVLGAASGKLNTNAGDQRSCRGAGCGHGHQIQPRRSAL